MDQTLQTAFNLRKTQQYEQAINLYEPLWQQGHHQFNEWAGWSYAFCLSKLNRHAEALEVCRRLYPANKHSQILNGLYAKCIYYTQHVSEPPPSPGTLRKATKAMIDLSPPHTPYSFTARGIFKLIKSLLAQNPIHWQEIEQLLLHLDPDLLDSKPFEMTQPNGKTTELASPLEEWYAQMVRVKGGLNQPKELLELIHAARSRNIKWHYNNDIWLARKEAFALQSLGDLSAARKILEQLVRKKPDWFLLHDLATVCDDAGEKIELMARAALAKGPPPMKVKLYEALYEELSKQPTHIQTAGMHLALVAAIREENGWPVPPAMAQRIAETGAKPQMIGSSSAILRELKPFWTSLTGHEPASRREGVISNVHENGKSGFVRAGKDSYFASFGGLRETPAVGSRVTFEIKDGFDKKKNKPSKMAVELKVVHQ